MYSLFKSKLSRMDHRSIPPEEEIVHPLVLRIREIVGFPASPGLSVSRKDLELPDDYPIHIDIGGEGANEHEGCISGFYSSINVNDHEKLSNDSDDLIPHLVKVRSWFKDPEYPFADGFADYITMQNAPLTPKNVDEIARCLRPGGIVDLWIDEWSAKDIQALAEKLNSTPIDEIDDEFEGRTGSRKVRIISHVKPTPTMTSAVSIVPKPAVSPEVDDHEDSTFRIKGK